MTCRRIVPWVSRSPGVRLRFSETGTGGLALSPINVRIAA
jgi:hypothetical protein